MTINELPGSQTTFKLEAGEGQRYVFGSHLATIIARTEDIGAPMAGAILSGAKALRSRSTGMRVRMKRSL